MVSDWQAAINRHDTALRNLRAGDAYTGITQSWTEIDNAFKAEFKLPSEWDCCDIVEINTGTKERQSGVITGRIKGNHVMVLFEDGRHWRIATLGCYVRRNQP